MLQPTLPPAARVIDKALELFGPNGEHWIQGKERSKDGFCMIGAINRARSVMKIRSAGAEAFVAKAIKRDGRFGNDPVALISGFNDSHRTNFENVREVLLLAKCDAMRAARIRTEMRKGGDQKLCDLIGL